MCDYCGCQQIDVVSVLTAEHDRLRELGHDLAAAANHADLTGARALAEAMLRLLAPHTEAEERGLFPLMARDFGAQIEALVDEHRSIEAALEDLSAPEPDVGWRHNTQVALAHLFDHILKEQDGVFPAALATLTASEWEVVAVAHATAFTATSAA